MSKTGFKLFTLSADSVNQQEEVCSVYVEVGCAYRVCSG